MLRICVMRRAVVEQAPGTQAPVTKQQALACYARRPRGGELRAQALPIDLQDTPETSLPAEHCGAAPPRRAQWPAPATAALGRRRKPRVLPQEADHTQVVEVPTAYVRRHRPIVEEAPVGNLGRTCAGRSSRRGRLQGGATRRSG